MSYASQLGTFTVTIRKRFISFSIPILICSLLSGICSFIIFGYFNIGDSGGPPPAAPPFGGGLFENAAYVALFYVGIAFIGAFGIFLIFKYGSIKLLKGIFAISIALTSFFFVFMFIITAPSYFLDLLKEGHVFSPRTNTIIMVIGIVMGLAYATLTVISMVYQVIKHPMPQIMAMLFAVLAGTFLATFLPTLAAVFVMIGLSIYDIISVFRGPIKKMAEISDERYNNETGTDDELPIDNDQEINDESLENVTIEDETEKLKEIEDEITSRVEKQEYEYVEYIELGLGDLAFFGTLISFALIKLGFFSAIAAFVGVIIGAIGTIKLLDKVKMMPGLPLSIGIGLVLAFGVWGILTLTGYDGWGYIYPNWGLG
ncbi:MAG: hypothetical protein FK733_08795 [Asgard group archaeon]|nr:hypothetical protein [Asgard group archaeon]